MKPSPLLIVSVLALCAVLFWFYRRHPLSARIAVGRTEFTVELAVTPVEKMKGLSGHTPLPDRTGMLFPYDHREQFPFWMNGMNYPLDFIWIADGTVVDITENVPVKTNGKITTVQPKVSVNQILEVPSGTVAKYGIKIGDTAKIID